MKKLMLTTLVLMAALLVTLPSSAQAALLNPGFEDGALGPSWGGGTIPNWSNWGSWEVQNSFVNSGSQALKVWETSTGIYQEFSVNSLFTYDISGYAYTPSGDKIASKDAVLTVEWYAGGPKLSEEEIGRLTPSDAAGTWKLLAKNVTPNSSATTARLFFNLQGTGAGAVGWDDFAATQGSPIPEPTSLFLLGSGLVGLLGISRRKSK